MLYKHINQFLYQFNDIALQSSYKFICYLDSKENARKKSEKYFIFGAKTLCSFDSFLKNRCFDNSNVSVTRKIFF